jgi:hypothetical protein
MPAPFRYYVAARAGGLEVVMIGRRALLALCALLLGAVVFAACDDGYDDPEPDGTPEAGGGSGDATIATEAEPASLARKFRESSFRADYELTNAAGDELEDDDLSIYKQTTERLRFDLSSGRDGETTDIVLIAAPEGSAFCLHNAGEFGELLGIPSGDGVCFADDPTLDATPSEFAVLVSRVANGEFEIIGRDERDIAGEDADCYTIRDAAGAESQMCLSEDGALLAATQPDGSSLEATDVTANVDVSDFALPYEIAELPTGTE